MREREIWPNGLRYLWTDAFGVVLLLSLYRERGEQQWLDEAEWVVAEVDSGAVARVRQDGQVRTMAHWNEQETRISGVQTVSFR